MILALLFLFNFARAEEYPLAPRNTTFCAALLTHEDWEELGSGTTVDATLEKIIQFVDDGGLAEFSDATVDHQHDGVIEWLREIGHRPEWEDRTREFVGREKIEMILQSAEIAASDIEELLVPEEFWTQARVKNIRAWPRLLPAVFSKEKRTIIQNQDTNRSYPTYDFIANVHAALEAGVALYYHGPFETIYTSAAVANLILNPPAKGADEKALAIYEDLLVKELNLAHAKTWELGNPETRLISLVFQYWMDPPTPHLVVSFRVINALANVRLPRGATPAAAARARAFKGVPQLAR